MSGTSLQGLQRQPDQKINIFGRKHFKAHTGYTGKHFQEPLVIIWELRKKNICKKFSTKWKDSSAILILNV